MVNWGFPTTTPWGKADDVLDISILDVVGGGVRIVFQPRSGYDGYFRVYVDGTPGGIVYAENGTDCEIFSPFNDPDFAATTHIVCLCPQGTWPSDYFDLSAQSFTFASGRLDRIWARMVTAPEYFVFTSSGVDTQFSSWALSGVQRFRNCLPVSGRPTWAAFSLVASQSGGVNTLTLYIGTIAVASGSRTGDGSITLSELNSSGVSGTVSITYSADVTGTLVMRFPDQLKIHYKTSTFSAPDFPRTAEGTVYDDGVSNVFFFRSARIAAGTYYLVPHQVNELGVESAGIAGGGSAVTVYTPPEAAGIPVYTSGDYADTLISFSASATSGATYNIYDSLDTGVLDINSVAANHAAGTGTLTQTLVAISSSFTGWRYIVIRAVNGGVEEGSYNLLKIEYDSGNVVPSRPNVPTFNERYSTSGRTVTVPVVLDTTNAKEVAATFKIYLATHGGAFNYASPDGTVTISTTISGIMFASVSATAAGDGYYDFTVRAQTAGGTQDAGTERVGPILLTTAAPLDPASFSVREGM